MMSSELIHVVACVRIPFLSKADSLPPSVETTFCLSAHLSMDSSCFHIVALVNNASISVGTLMSLQDPAFTF